MKPFVISIFLISILFAVGGLVGSENPEIFIPENETRAEKILTLTDAIMCEEVKEYLPGHNNVVFSTSLGKAVCYTSFDPVPEKLTISHNWFRRDVLSTSIKLDLNPPRWATYSTIQLREADKGPWRVEITDPEGKIMKTLRFSITD